MDYMVCNGTDTAPDSENRIHSDELAQQYGFEGGLVPGVTISFPRPFGRTRRGKTESDEIAANCRITSPLYDGELFDVTTDLINDSSARTTMIMPTALSVTRLLKMGITNLLPPAPKLRQDKPAEPDYQAPNASKAVTNNCNARLPSV